MRAAIVGGGAPPIDYNPALGICRLKEAAATATPDIAATQRVEIREGRRCPTMPIRLTVGMMPPARISTNTWPGWNDFLFARACFAAAVNRWLPGAKIHPAQRESTASRVISSFSGHGLDEPERRRIADALVRKGCPGVDLSMLPDH